MSLYEEVHGLLDRTGMYSLSVSEVYFIHVISSMMTNNCEALDTYPDESTKVRSF